MLLGDFGNVLEQEVRLWEFILVYFISRNFFHLYWVGDGGWLGLRVGWFLLLVCVYKWVWLGFEGQSEYRFSWVYKYFFYLIYISQKSNIVVTIGSTEIRTATYCNDIIACLLILPCLQSYPSYPSLHKQKKSFCNKKLIKF